MQEKEMKNHQKRDKLESGTMRIEGRQMETVADQAAMKLKENEESPLLSVRNLHTSFFTDSGEVKAVNGVSFNLPKGKILGVVGESGSGKSVTAYSIMQILADTGRVVEGEILFKGDGSFSGGEGFHHLPGPDDQLEPGLYRGLAAEGIVKASYQI